MRPLLADKTGRLTAAIEIFDKRPVINSCFLFDLVDSSGLKPYQPLLKVNCLWMKKENCV
jgi:hypothetical protein